MVVYSTKAKHGGMVKKFTNDQLIAQFPDTIVRAIEVGDFLSPSGETLNLFKLYQQFMEPITPEKYNSVLEAQNPEANGKTLLQFAVLKGNNKIVNDLLNKPGMDVNVLSKEGKTALDYAMDKGDMELMDKLIAKGAVFKTQLRTESGKKSMATSIYEAIGKIPTRGEIGRQAINAAYQYISGHTSDTPTNTPAIEGGKSNSYVTPQNAILGGAAVVAAVAAKKFLGKKKTR
jgi:hypothetical protein